MIIQGFIAPPRSRAWASVYGYRSFRGASFYGENPKPNTTYFCAENSSNCKECYSCCASSFPTKANRRAGCERRCRRKFPASECTGTGQTTQPPAPPAPPGAEMCPVVCVPDGTGVTCNYNCMGVSMNIINTDVPGEVIPLQKAKSLFNRDAWLNRTSSSWGAGSLPMGAGTYIPTEDLGGGGIIDTITSNLPMIAVIGGGLFLATKFLK